MTTNTPNPPSGWYPDARDPHLLRYWNGLSWTPQTRPVASAPAAPAPPAPAVPPPPVAPQPVTPQGYPPAQTYPVPAPGAVPGAMPAGWGAPAGAIQYCRVCAAPLMAQAPMCPRCGTAVGTPKDKTVAVLLAVFLSGWTWLYTYQRDAWKFWTAFGIWVGGVALLWLGVGILAFPAIWIWAIIDVAVKDESFYQRFPNG